jgi:hypothetical protein
MLVIPAMMVISLMIAIVSAVVAESGHFEKRRDQHWSGKFATIEE